jgi:RimJ/RimL family protein N-acetyltransferase
MYRHVNGINIRKAEIGDLLLLKALKSDSWWGTHSCPLLNDIDQEKWLRSLPSTSYCMIHVYEGDRAGVAMFTDHDPVGRTIKVSGSMFSGFREDAIIKACCTAQIDFAFEYFNLHRIEAEALESNYAAQKYEIDYLGFRIEGVKRQAVYKLGRYYNSLVLGLLRSEWGKDGQQLNTNVDHALATRLSQRCRDNRLPSQ